jgi:hypothetical protein
MLVVSRQGTVESPSVVLDDSALQNAIKNINTGVHAVTLESGSNNGTLKLTVDSIATDNIAVTGLGTAAY